MGNIDYELLLLGESALAATHVSDVDCTACGKRHADMPVRPTGGIMENARGAHSHRLYVFICPARNAVAIDAVAAKSLRRIAAEVA